MEDRKHPFGELIGFTFDSYELGASRCRLQIKEEHMNPQGFVHGGVLFAMADTGMGGALCPYMEAGRVCTTVEVRINYFKPVKSGELVCTTQVVNQGRKLAYLESEIFNQDKLVAKATGTYAIFKTKK